MKIDLYWWKCKAVRVSLRKTFPGAGDTTLTSNCEQCGTKEPNGTCKNCLCDTETISYIYWLKENRRLGTKELERNTLSLVCY